MSAIARAVDRMDPKTAAVVDFQREIVKDVLGRRPEADVNVETSDDVCDMIISSSRALAMSGFEGEGERDADFEDTIADAVALYALAASTVRWNECSLSKDDPQYTGKILTRMMSETMKAPIRAKTLSNEFRLAPYRVPALFGYRAHCHDGKVDFMEWMRTAEDPAFIENVAAVFLK